MKVAGTFTFRTADIDAVWKALTDPEKISACLPGCEGLEGVGDGEYRMTMHVGIGPIRSAYSGRVRIRNADRPSGYTMAVDASGSGGFANGEGSVQLADRDGVIEVAYDGQVAVGGRIAAVGQRMVGGAARMVIDQFFKCAASSLD